MRKKIAGLFEKAYVRCFWAVLAVGVVLLERSALADDSKVVPFHRISIKDATSTKSLLSDKKGRVGPINAYADGSFSSSAYRENADAASTNAASANLVSTNKVAVVKAKRKGKGK